MTRSEKVLAFIKKYCRVPEGNLVGQPIQLTPEQEKFICAVYDGNRKVRRAILSIARKNGKTTLIACLVLVHLVGSEAQLNSQIASGAMSKENAALVFNLCVKMINLNPDLQSIIRIVPSKKELFGLPMNVHYQALAKDGRTNMGGSPVLLILDETGQVVGSNDYFIDAVTTSQGAHENPLMLCISTQAASDSDLLSIWIDDALKSKDEGTVCHLYAADKDAEVLDEKAWYAANFGLGKFRSLEDMKRMANEASRMPSFENSFRNLYLNQRVSTNSPFISRSAWQACGGEAPPFQECEELFGGLDLSAKTDLTAFVLYGLHEGKWYSYVWAWTPEQGLHERVRRDRAPYDVWVKQGILTTTPSASIKYDYIAHELLEICDQANVTAIAYDRWRMDVLKAELEKIGAELPLIEWGQGYKDMAPAMDAIEGAILNKTFCHGDNPLLTMCASNTMVTRSPAGDRKPDKHKASGRIDCMVALMMAAGIAERRHESQGDFDAFISNPLVL